MIHVIALKHIGHVQHAVMVQGSEGVDYLDLLNSFVAS
jgi:hypothetical protein